MNWLFKEEPENYSFDALVKDKRTVWSGVKNPSRKEHLHAVKRGDRIFYYHTGNEKAVVGIAKALGDGTRTPPTRPASTPWWRSGPSSKLARPVTLAEIKADATFKTFPLVRISRLSVMPVTDEEWHGSNRWRRGRKGGRGGKGRTGGE